MGIIYLIYVQPFASKMLNYLEIFNELSILSLSYHSFIFTDFVPSPEIKYIFGYSLIGITTLNLLINMIILIGQGGKNLFTQIKTLI